MLVKSQVKYIQSLGHKKFRDQEGVFAAEGRKLVEELLKAGNIKPVQLFALKTWINENRSLAGSMPGSMITAVDEAELQRISFLTTANQVLGIFKKPAFPPVAIKGRISLVLDGIQDPGNMGTIIRIADWFGLQQIICSEDSADAFNPKVVQSTMGSIGRVQVLYRPLKSFFAENPALPVYATVLEGKDLFALDRLSEGLVIIGNESRGISEELLQELRYERITIPRKGKAESLNAAVAAGIILSHLV